MNIKKILSNEGVKKGLVIGAVAGVLAEFVATNDLLGMAKYISPAYVGFVGILGPASEYGMYLFPVATALVGGVIGYFIKKR